MTACAAGRLNASHPGGPQLAAVHGTADRAALEDIGNLPALEVQPVSLNDASLMSW